MGLWGRMLPGNVGLLFLICAVYAQEFLEEDAAETRVELRDFNQNWKAVDYFSPMSDTSGWIPHREDTLSQDQAQAPKRRRIRKRKRRPPMITLTDENLETSSSIPKMREPWEEASEMEEKTRRRIGPVYYEPETETSTPKQTFERVRDPFTALQEAEEKQKPKIEETTTQPPINLKTLLKQTGNALSLSEILQQKNLSLAELLMGNREAISALTEPPQEKSDVTEPDDNSDDKIDFHRKSINRNYESSEGMTSEEVLEAQRKRLGLLHKDTKLFQDVTRFDVITEATTDKRIFIPAQFPAEILMQNSRNTEKKPVFVLKPKLRGNLPMTSAKLNKMVTKSPEVSTTVKLPPKAFKIDVKELFGFNNVKVTTTTTTTSTTTEGPMKIDLMPTLLEKINEQTTQSDKEILFTTLTPLGEKLKHVTAKEEIMEILKDPRDREHLSRILQIRNMTVDELVEQRERGSSQLHLADIFHNKTREPEPKDEPFIGHIRPEIFTNFSNFNRKQKSRPIPTVVKKELSTSAFTTEQPKEYTITSFPTYKIESKNPQSFLPPWKDIYPSLFPDLYQNNYPTSNDLEFIKLTTTTTERYHYENVGRLEEIENKLVEATNDHLNIDLLQDHRDSTEEFLTLPSGVKSAILASSAIIILSLLVFLTILFIFKWNQKQKRRLNYSGSFSGSKIKSPILEQAEKRSFRTIMTETLGRKRNYYKSHLQSMSDSIWDADKKPYM